MSNNKKFRSEEARKHYEKAERQRAQAKQRKAWAARKTDFVHSAQAWLKSHAKQAIGAAAAAICVIVLAVVLFNTFTDPLRNKQDNWLIVNISNTTNADYRHLANFDIPQGYTLDDYSSYLA